MSEQFSNRQRSNQQKRKGRPVLSLEFDVYEDGECSMWAHTRHEVPFLTMKAAFEKIEEHIHKFIEEGDMCPFNPEFKEGKEV